MQGVRKPTTSAGRDNRPPSPRKLLELGRLPEAKSEIAQATRLASQYESTSLRLKTNTVTAQVLAAEGQPEAASRKLRATIQETRQRGFFILRMYATLALAEVQAKSGKKTEAHRLFQSVEKDARSKGFLLVARNALADRSL